MIRYSNDARSDLLQILDYTIDRWGEAQANRYLADLHQHFNQIEKMPGIGRACLDVHPGLYQLGHGQHFIFYLPESTGIFVCRVLHVRMLAGYEDFLSSFAESIE